MKKLTAFASLAALVAASPLTAQEAKKEAYPSPNEIVNAAPASDWKAIAASDLLVMDLTPDAAGPSTGSGERRIIIQLMPPPFSQGWIGNIRKLAKAGFWDGTSINRVQDNYVVQWGDAAEEEKDRKALPEGLVTVPKSEYVSYDLIAQPAGATGRIIARPAKIKFKDVYAGAARFWSGWPFAFSPDREGFLVVGRFKDGKIGGKLLPPEPEDTVRYWPIHCYGAIGVGRGYSPDTGTGAELYTVIGHAPRHLDRNIAVVGRIIEGIENLSSLPRGTGPLGFYEKAEQRVTIKSIRLASELAKADQPRFEYLSTESAPFAKYADARANRRDPFFIKPAGGADICNIPVPVRRVKAD